MTAPSAPRPPWWLWPNILCLDAPAVAVLWLVIFGSVYGMGAPGAAIAVLLLTVWSLYVADRLIDVLRRRAGDPAPGLRSPRHDFAATHFKPLALLAALAAAAGFFLALAKLERPVLGAGMIVAVAAAAYFGAFVAPLGGKKPLPGKEIAGGVLFAAGVTVAVFADYSGSWPVVPAFSLFAGLCALNMLMLNSRTGDLPLPAWLPTLLGIMLTAAAVTAAYLEPLQGGVGFRPLRPLYASIAISAALLTLLQATGRRRLGREAFHVLADAALLAPLGFLIS